MTAVFVFGPPGCGKTRNAQQLKQHFGCTRIVDEWDGRNPIQSGDLVLTVAPPNHAVQVIHFDDAMLAIEKESRT